MNSYLRLVVIGLLIGAAPAANAGKVDDVKAALKSQCSKDVADSDALRMVKELYMNCTPDTKVDIDGCKVTCLKANAGAVVGQ